ncbi:MAG: M48 family metallopeptidase [Leptospiraceae bacterium]|nr:M48 family metallopeptidase [Leptospiraceae bacterium]
MFVWEKGVSRREFLQSCLGALGAAGFSSLVFVRCTTTPTGKKAFILISEEEETKLGESAFTEIMAQEKPSKNKRQADLLRKVGQRIAAVSHRPDHRWQFELIASEQVNAFALPGGKVAFYEGIMPFCQNEAGIACVMGHEVGHVAARHGAQRISQQLAVQGALTAVDLSVTRNSKNRNVILGALGVGATLGVLLPYSREHEYEADKLGLMYMAKAGYDPEEAVLFWERFAELSKGQPKVPEFLSTHPMSENRVREMRKNLPEAKRLYDAAPVKYGKGETV